MNKTLLMAAAAAFVITAGGVASAAVPLASNVTMMGGKPHAAPIHDPKLTVLYDQTANNSGIGIVSQAFEASFSAYDSQSADDFVVPKGSTWTVKEVYASGEYFNGSGPATSENVYFYKVKKGLPGKLLMEFPSVKGKDDSGSFTIKLPKGGMVLKAGTYFVSVQANLSFDAGGEWGWNATTSSTAIGNPAAWQNPGGGFGVCPTWGPEDVCISAGQGADDIFQILGSSK